MCHRCKMSCYVESFGIVAQNVPEDENIFVRIVPKNLSNVGDKPGYSFDEVEFQRINNAHWVSNYADDIYKTLQEDELKRRRVQFHSAQTQYRPTLLHLLRSVTEICKLNRCTLHLSVYLLDRFTDCFTIRVDKLNLTALTCLRIASQVEDADPNIPKYAELNRIVSFIYHWHEFKTVERKILVTLDFGLLRPTTAHFVEHFAGRFLTLEDYKNHKASCDSGGSNKTNSPLLPTYDSFEQMLNAHTKLLFELADLTLICHRLSNIRPSMLAASCIACVRSNSGLKPLWTPHLEKLTTYDESTIKTYIEVIITMYEVHKQRQKNTFDSYLEKQQQNVQSTPKQDTANEMEWNSPDSGICTVSIQDISENLPTLVKPQGNFVGSEVQHIVVVDGTSGVSHNYGDYCNAVVNQDVSRDNGPVSDGSNVDDGVVSDKTDDTDVCMDHQRPAKRLKLM